MTAKRSWASLAKQVDAELREATDLERQEFTRGYFPSALENLGVAVPVVRRIVRRLKRELKDLSGAEAIEAARAILAKNTLEGRNVGYLFLNEHPNAVHALTLAILEDLGRGMDNWTSVDTFGCYVAGPAWREGRVRDADIHRWARSPDRWWRRAALVSTVALNLRSRGGNGDTGRTLAVCSMLVSDHDDMVVKGLSWALRSLIGHDESAVGTFLDEHAERIHSRCRREVANKLTTGLKSGKDRPRKKA